MHSYACLNRTVLDATREHSPDGCSAAVVVVVVVVADWNQCNAMKVATWDGCDHRN